MTAEKWKAVWSTSASFPILSNCFIQFGLNKNPRQLWNHDSRGFLFFILNKKPAQQYPSKKIAKI
jgi:hypothetical protein